MFSFLMIQQEMVGQKNRKTFNHVIRDHASEFGNVYAEEIVRIQFTNGSSHFHRRHI